MDRPQPGPVTDFLPGWLVGLGSAVICVHLGAVLIWVLAAPSGPWPTLEGPEPFIPPRFATSVSRPAREYLKAIKLTHNYHFATNRHQDFAAYLEVRLKDDQGKEIARVKFPEDDANFWVRHRESVLTNWFADDLPVAPPQGEVIAAPGQKVPTVTIWDESSPRELQLKTVPMHLVPRDRPVSQPTEVAMLLAQSYARFLCRQHGAKSAEVIRHAKPSIPPGVILPDGVPPGGFEEFTSDFGDLPARNDSSAAR